MPGVRSQIFRGVAVIGGCQHKIKTDRAAQRLRVGVGQHPMLKLRGKQHQQPRLRGDVPVVLIQRMLRFDGPAITGSETWHQLIRSAWSMDTQNPVLTGAGSGQIKDSTEVSIGVVMATDQLIPVAHNRPATLKMQGNLLEIKTDGIEIVPGLIGHKSGQINKIGLAMQLPDPIDVSGPGATFGGIPCCGTAQHQNVLQIPSQIERVQDQLNRGHSRGEKLVNLEGVHSKPTGCLSLTLPAMKTVAGGHGHKKTGPWGPVDQAWCGKVQLRSRATHHLKNLLGDRSLAGLVVIQSQCLGEFLGVVAGIVHGRHPAGQL